jgi:protein-S-isoprenylcysteine O-methyltransferase Ste14
MRPDHVEQDQTFRSVLIVGMFLVFPIAVSYRIKSQSTREPLDRWQEGRFILFTLRPIGLAGMAGLIAYLINPMLMAWSSIPVPPGLRWTGVAIGAFGGSLIVWTFHSLGRNLTDTVVTRREHTLVTHGPYRWVRHPFYDAVALAVAGNALAAANWFLGLTGILTLALLIARTRIEEEKLVARFGDRYRDYMNDTGRFLPRSIRPRTERV